jgi:hypothetical protein|tara:strand:- start:473 stop:694 length:222 start_codon:yes stop_codon:yes gene_type:complete
MRKMKTLENWNKELIYYNKSVSWIDKFGIKHALWSKVPRMNYETGELIRVDNVKKALQYYNWIKENKPELLEI